MVYGIDDIDCDDGGFYIRADPTSRTHFYKCDNGEPVRFKCPDGLCYNQKLHVCDWPKNVDKTAKGTSSNSLKEYSDNNGKPANTIIDKNGNNNKKPYNNELQYTGNNKKPSNNEVQYLSNNGNPSNNEEHYTGNNKKPSNDKVQYSDNNQQLSNSAYQQNSKPTNTNTPGQTGGSSTTGAGFEEPWHYQSYSTDDPDLYAVQIIDKKLNLDGLGYKGSSQIDIRKA